MRRFYLPPHECQPDYLTLSGGEARHAAEVLRIRPGEDAAILDGEGREFFCHVETVERKKIQLKILQTRVSPAPPCPITLVQAIPKGKILESIIQKATELGVSRIIPLLSERVTTHLEGESVERKAERWRQTAIEAIKQCGQRWLPKVEPPIPWPRSWPAPRCTIWHWLDLCKTARASPRIFSKLPARTSLPSNQCRRVDWAPKEISHPAS